MVFVFATGTMMNANTYKKNIEEIMFLDCFEYADGLANIYEETHPYSGSEASYNVFVHHYNDCLSGSAWEEGEFYLAE